MNLNEKVQRFLFHEAWLADSHAYQAWFGLWAEDCVYWIPCNDDNSDPSRRVSIIYETYEDIRDRVDRLSGDHVFAQQPKTRLSRVISNVIAEPGEDGLVDVRSVINITAFRRNIFEIFAGRVEHRLRPIENGYQIVRKTVYLVNNNGYMGNMTFLV